MRFLSAAVAACLVAGLGAGCSVTNHSKTGGAVSVNQYADVQASLDIGQDVEANVKVTEFLIFKFGLPNEYADGISYGPAGGGGGLLAGVFGGGTAEAAKSAAAYKAVSSGGYDVLLGARYVVKTDDFFIFKKYDVTVRGRGAKITGYAQTQ